MLAAVAKDWPPWTVKLALGAFVAKAAKAFLLDRSTICAAGPSRTIVAAFVTITAPGNWKVPPTMYVPPLRVPALRLVSTPPLRMNVRPPAIQMVPVLANDGDVPIWLMVRSPPMTLMVPLFDVAELVLIVVAWEIVSVP